MNEAWPGIYDERYIHQFQPQPDLLEQILIDHGDNLNRTRVIINCTMKWGIFFEFEGNSMETDTKTWSEVPNRGKGTVEQRLNSEERGDPKEKSCNSNSYGSE